LSEDLVILSSIANTYRGKDRKRELKPKETSLLYLGREIRMMLFVCGFKKLLFLSRIGKIKEEQRVPSDIIWHGKASFHTE